MAAARTTISKHPLQPGLAMACDSCSHEIMAALCHAGRARASAKGGKGAEKSVEAGGAAAAEGNGWGEREMKHKENQ